MSNSPLIIAHRGASAYAPENTLAAFQLAVETGADGVEFDVQLSRDGVPVVIHDAKLTRTASRDDKVSNLTSTELQDIDVGSWFNDEFPDAAKPEYKDQRIPTLIQVLESLADFGGLIYIELKARDKDFMELVGAVCDVIGTSPLLPQMIVKSFKLAAITEVRHQLLGVKTAALFSPKIMDYLRQRKYMLDLAREFGADQISLHRSLATRGLGRRAGEINMPLTVWTVDDPKWIRRSIKLGIGALITNDPARLIAERGNNWDVASAQLWP